MNVLEIVILGIIALVIGLIPQTQIRTHLLLFSSILVVYWLQSRDIPIYSITFWLPTLTMILVALSWVLTASFEIDAFRKNWAGITVFLIAILSIDLTRYTGSPNLFFPDMAIPRLLSVLAVLLFVFFVALMTRRILFLNRFNISIALIVLLSAFLMIKSPDLNRLLYQAITTFTNIPQKTNDTFIWLGFSYFAFRIIHTLRDRQKGLLPSVTLAEYATYVLFFPAFVAGPIDRIERFIGDLRTPAPLTDSDWLFAGRRFLLGLFKKFVIADALSVFALNPKIFPQIHSTTWFWILLYTYAFQIYFDFSGYSDIAIGIAKMIGIRLPENFNNPYLKPNLTQFWNNWHITLTQWFRAYFFNPMQRWLRSSGVSIPVWLLILSLQISTMTLIGLWHGFTFSFVLWGIWHGLGLFLHNRWRESMSARISAWADNSMRKAVLNIAGIFLTFHYVVIGWVFFVLPFAQIPSAISLMLGLQP